jgi:hypothetical protein
MKEVDRAALARAIEMEHSKSDGAVRLGFEKRMQTEPFEELGQYAAYSCQIDCLGLQPWQHPPCNVEPANIKRILDAGSSNDDLHGRYDAAVLLKRLLDSGLSRWEPDPPNALLQAKLLLPSPP